MPGIVDSEVTQNISPADAVFKGLAAGLSLLGASTGLDRGKAGLPNVEPGHGNVEQVHGVMGVSKVAVRPGGTGHSPVHA